MKALFYLLIHLYPSNITELLPVSDSPNSILFGLLGLMFIGVVQAVFGLLKLQKETKKPKPFFAISDAQFN
jgi:hypothetical protein